MRLAAALFFVGVAGAVADPTRLTTSAVVELAANGHMLRISWPGAFGNATVLAGDELPATAPWRQHLAFPQKTGDEWFVEFPVRDVQKFFKLQVAAFAVQSDYPHDPEAFCQGLLWHEGSLYESTGLFGRSSLRQVEFPTGKVLRQKALPASEFGEGLARVGNGLVQLTWRSHKGYVYDVETFAVLREFTYASEGWGLTFDGKSLIMSDGTSRLTFFDAQTLTPTRQVEVTMDARPITHLNELEYIEGEVWANVWQTDFILRIDPRSGQVTSFLNLSGLQPREPRHGGEDVLNGIAYDPVTKRIFVAGKLWPRIFEIKLNQ